MENFGLLYNGCDKLTKTKRPGNYKMQINTPGLNKKYVNPDVFLFSLIALL